MGLLWFKWTSVQQRKKESVGCEKRHLQSVIIQVPKLRAFKALTDSLRLLFYKFMLLWTTYLLHWFLELLVIDCRGVTQQSFPCYWGISCWSQWCMLHNFAYSWKDYLYHELIDAERTSVHKDKCKNSKIWAPSGTEELCVVTGCEKSPRFCRESFGLEWNRGACFCSIRHALVCGMSLHPKKLIWSRGGKGLMQSGILSEGLDFHERRGFLLGRSSGNMVVLLALTSNKLLT